MSIQGRVSSTSSEQPDASQAPAGVRNYSGGGGDKSTARSRHCAALYGSLATVGGVRWKLWTTSCSRGGVAHSAVGPDGGGSVRGGSDGQAPAATGANGQLLQVPAGGSTVPAVVPDYQPHSGKSLAWWHFSFLFSRCWKPQPLEAMPHPRWCPPAQAC